MTDQYIANLVQYGVDSGLISDEERIYSTNLILDAMGILEYDEGVTPQKDSLENILKGLLDDAVQRGICEDDIVSRDLFDSRLMNCITPRPSEVIGRFGQLYNEDKKKATDYFYKFSQDTDYIRR